MAISGISQSELDALGLSSNTAQTQKKAALGQDDFLKLMVTQLKSQDPFKPMEDGQFLAQLAQFSTVSGINELKTSFADFSSSMVSNQALQASGLLGREVLVNKSTGLLEAGGSLGAAIDLTASAGDVRVQVKNASGEIVRNVSLGTQPAGLASFKWDGVTDKGEVAPAGQYTITAQPVINGKVQPAASVLVEARVESVTIGGTQGLTLSLKGLGDVAFADVRKIS
jgi:flagellar basal-body rod modification protein FlgD